MRTIKKGFKREETLPLPVWRDENDVLQYDSDWADKLICQAYGDDQTKYEVQPSTLELYYIVSDKMRFKVAQITYESYFTDIKGQEWEKEWMETFNEISGTEGKKMSAEQYEMYNLTLYHYNHPSLKSNFLDDKNNIKGINTEEYIKDIMDKIEREDFDEDDPYYK